MTRCSRKLLVILGCILLQSSSVPYALTNDGIYSLSWNDLENQGVNRAWIMNQDDQCLDVHGSSATFSECSTLNMWKITSNENSSSNSFDTTKIDGSKIARNLFLESDASFAQDGYEFNNGQRDCLGRTREVEGDNHIITTPCSNNKLGGTLWYV